MRDPGRSARKLSLFGQWYFVARVLDLKQVSTFVVTGCAGFIGSHLTEALLLRGDSVIGIDAFTDYYPRAAKDANIAPARRHPRFRLVEADLTEVELSHLLSGSDGVFHLAAQPGVRGSWGESFSVYAKDNILVTQRLFEAAAAAGIRVVFASTSSLYGNAEQYPTAEDVPPRPISPYGITKLACEHLAYAYGGSHALDCVAMRYFTVYGPRQRPDMAFTRIAFALQAGHPFEIYGSGKQSRDVTYVHDAVNATLAAMSFGASGAVYNVGGGSEASLNDVMALCEALSGRRLRRRFSECAAGDVRRTAADTSRARGDLGWAPQTTLEDGLRAQLEWAFSPAATAAHVPALAAASA